MTQTDGETYHVLGLGESILWKWLYHQKQSTDSMKSLSNNQGHFLRTRTKSFTISMETKRTSNSQSNLEKEKQSWRNKAPWLQTIPQSYSNYVKFWRPWQRKRRIHLTSTILKQIADLIKNLPRRMSVRQKLMKKNCNIKVKVNITCKVQM